MAYCVELWMRDEWWTCVQTTCRLRDGPGGIMLAGDIISWRLRVFFDTLVYTALKTARLESCVEETVYEKRLRWSLHKWREPTCIREPAILMLLGSWIYSNNLLWYNVCWYNVCWYRPILLIISLFCELRWKSILWTALEINFVKLLYVVYWYMNIFQINFCNEFDIIYILQRIWKDGIHVSGCVETLEVWPAWSYDVWIYIGAENMLNTSVELIHWDCNTAWYIALNTITSMLRGEEMMYFWIAQTLDWACVEILQPVRGGCVEERAV